MNYLSIVFISCLLSTPSCARERSAQELYNEHRKHYTEDNILELVRLYVPKNPVILEAGAHHGIDTCKMKNIWPYSTIHAFEPHPDNHKRLLASIRGLEGITVYPLALTNHNGTAQFYRCRLHDGASSLLKAPPHREAFYNDQTPILVSTLTLDEWAQRFQVDHVDFCWLDMEGAELRMLEHARMLLQTARAIYIEVNFQEFRVGMVQYHDVKKFLNEHGFVEIWMTPTKRICPEDEQANVLFVRQELIPQPR